MRITMTREALLEKLNERLAAAKAEDARIAKTHRDDEAKALKAFRDRLREALKWDYATAKEHSFKAGLEYGQHPRCPTLQSLDIARAVRLVGWDTRKNPFSITQDSELYRALNWKPASEREPQTVCD